MQYAINYSSKKRPTFFKTNKQKQTEYLSQKILTTRKSDTHFNTNHFDDFSDMQEEYLLDEGFFHNIIIGSKWDGIMIVIFQEIKTEKTKTKSKQTKQNRNRLMENYFFVCACCVLTKFFLNPRSWVSPNFLVENPSLPQFCHSN